MKFAKICNYTKGLKDDIEIIIIIVRWLSYVFIKI